MVTAPVTKSQRMMVLPSNWMRSVTCSAMSPKKLSGGPGSMGKKEPAIPPKKNKPATMIQTVSTLCLVAALQLAEQAQHLNIQPHQGNHQPESAIPLHVLRHAFVRGALDKIEIEQ